MCQLFQGPEEERQKCAGMWKYEIHFPKIHNFKCGPKESVLMQIRFSSKQFYLDSKQTPGKSIKQTKMFRRNNTQKIPHPFSGYSPHCKKKTTDLTNKLTFFKIKNSLK